MASRRYSRLFVLLASCLALVVIGRNLYRRQVNDALVAAVRQDNPGAVQAALDRGADPDRILSNPQYTSHQTVLGWALARFYVMNPMPNSEQITCLLLRKSKEAR